MQKYIIDDLLRKIYSKITTENDAIAHEVLTLSTTSVFSLTPPPQAKYALCVVEEVGATGSAKILRYLLDGSNPTTSVGIPRGDMDVFDISGWSNIRNFRAIKIAGGNHTITVQYFS